MERLWGAVLPCASYEFRPVFWRPKPENQRKGSLKNEVY